MLSKVDMENQALHLLVKHSIAYEFVFMTTSGKVHIEAFGAEADVKRDLEKAGFLNVTTAPDWMEGAEYVIAHCDLPEHDYTTGPMPAPVAHKIAELAALPDEDADPLQQALVNIRDVIVHHRHPVGIYTNHERIILDIVKKALGES